MNNKVKMKRHESFSIREGWLAKGIRTIKEDSKVFSSADATDILGIGTNMVKSLKYWMTATCLIEESNRSISLSKFGELIDKYDPYLEDNFSWWLIHLNMILNIEDSYIYKLEYNENILQDEVNMIIKTYSIDEKIDNPENNFICPLSELNLIKKVDINAYERIKPDFRSLNYLIVYYLMILLSEDKEYLSIDDLIKLDNSPAKLLNLDKNLINEYLDEMKKHDLIIINRTAGLNMIYFNKKLSIDEIMREHFE